MIKYKHEMLTLLYFVWFAFQIAALTACAVFFSKGFIYSLINIFVVKNLQQLLMNIAIVEKLEKT